MTEQLLAYLLIGAFTGLLAGLLGVGGGVVIVPALTLLLPRYGAAPQVTMHLALGTSLASILFTSASSFRAHHRRGSVRWEIWRAMVPGVLLGTFAGSLGAGRVPTAPLQAFFAAFLFWVAWKMLRPRTARPVQPGLTADPTSPASPVKASLDASDANSGPSRPTPWDWALSGGIIGIISSLVGIGGGSLTVPLLERRRIPLTQAIGTSAAVGFPIALAGSIGYMLTGQGAAQLPSYSLGFIYLPAWGGIVAASVLTAPLGVSLAHRLPTQTVRRAFAALLLVVATRMAFKLLG
jgi:uncharacterized membrane protein YfcA